MTPDSAPRSDLQATPDLRPSNAPQLASPSYRIAEFDDDFLAGDSMRGVRLMLEHAKADEILKRWRIVSTVVVFGSARVHETGPGAHARWYAEARAFGRLCSLEGGALDGTDGDRHNVIATGGGPGLMEAANRGAWDVGAPSIGLNITLPREQQPNPYSTPDLTFRFNYFAMRKLHLAMRARALLVFPGGFGTFDELFELVTLTQTHKTPPIPILMFDSAYWNEVVNFQALVRHGTISPTDLDLLTFVESAAEAWSWLKPRIAA
jgi:uncharacterized protein (TIGR00730 family)